MLTVMIGESTMSRTQVQLWYNENIEVMKKMILDKLRITIREIADDVGISYNSCQAIFMTKQFLRQRR